MPPARDPASPGRRTALQALTAGAISSLLAARMAGTQGPPDVHTRPIPSSGERLPIIGLGSWITFNVGRDVEARLACTEVIRHFFARGGRLIDSSPMYGSSQEVIGAALRALGSPRGVFAADKIWSSSPSEGPTQAEETRRRWGVTRLDLLQVHNLEAWEAHLPRLFEMKAAGAIRYVGVTTSHGRRTSETERLVRTQPLDFVQVTYNIVDRELDARLLPLARDRGIAVIVNRPFQEGALLARFARRPLPAWAREFGAASWPQFLLKFVVSHAAVTCAIPATSQPAHVIENMDAAYGPLPDATQRRRMVAWIESS